MKILLMLTSCLLAGHLSIQAQIPVALSGATKQTAKPATPKTLAGKKPKNIIFMIGDGMGTAQIYAAMTARKDATNFERFKVIGFHKTYSFDDYITDSAAGATAFSTGYKTNNGAVGVDATGKAQPTILEMAEKKGLATGLVVTCSITHATPACFFAHQPSRKMNDEIAKDLIGQGVDVVIGGGRQYFENRKDSITRTIMPQLVKEGFQTPADSNALYKIKSGRVLALLAQDELPKMSEGRGAALPNFTSKAISLLKQQQKGYFLMVEGSQIDWGGHSNDTQYIIRETLDFDKAIGKALDIAQADGETLVIVTADHETGGFTLPAGNIKSGTVEGKFTTEHHTGVMVPVFAFGPGAQEFAGIYENTAIFTKMKNLLQLNER